jgi:hypothetical protein
VRGGEAAAAAEEEEACSWGVLVEKLKLRVAQGCDERIAEGEAKTEAPAVDGLPRTGRRAAARREDAQHRRQTMCDALATDILKGKTSLGYFLC